MDLCAFLTPGVYPVFFRDDPDQERPWAHIISRPGRRISWLTSEAGCPGADVVVRLSLPGYRLEPDGSLASEDGKSAPIVLFGKIKASRPLAEHHVLRFATMIRILD
ncbi:MAG: hypothetical protein LBT47_05070 [Deltaproteobacteria bacterium]|nr:hypothetical protein [Deltaproteobacteria bacterium]